MSLLRRIFPLFEIHPFPNTTSFFLSCDCHPIPIHVMALDRFSFLPFFFLFFCWVKIVLHYHAVTVAITLFYSYYAYCRLSTIKSRCISYKCTICISLRRQSILIWKLYVTFSKRTLRILQRLSISWKRSKVKCFCFLLYLVIVSMFRWSTNSLSIILWIKRNNRQLLEDAILPFCWLFLASLYLCKRVYSLVHP